MAVATSSSRSTCSLDTAVDCAAGLVGVVLQREARNTLYTCQ